MMDDLNASPLGHRSDYKETYEPSLLFPIARSIKRDELGISAALPFKGYDLWTAYELSWLNLVGKPVVALANIIIPCESPNIIESKSLKLYLNSFNNTHFASEVDINSSLINDLSAVVGTLVKVELFSVDQRLDLKSGQFSGIYLDELEVTCSEYSINPQLLQIHDEEVLDLKVYSHLLKSNCLVTGQPDWGSIWINYSGPRIDESSLLQYLVSFRNHNEFHEQCVERIFSDILTYCRPKKLTVYARYTRRGGVDINPIRSTHFINPPLNQRLLRQ